VKTGLENSDNNGGEKLTRRHLLKVLAAFGAEAAIPSKAQAHMPQLPSNILSDPEIFKQRIAAAELAYSSPRVQALLREGDSSEAVIYLTNHILDLNQQILASPEFDISALQSKVMLFGVEDLGNRKLLRTTTLQRASIEDALTLADADQQRIGYGQAIPIGRSVVLTPKHVFEFFDGVAEVMGAPDLTYDAAWAHIVGMHFTPSQIAHFKQMTDADVHGHFVAMTGIRPDNNLGSTGRKTYGGIAIQITKPLYEFFKDTVGTDGERRALRKSLVVVSETREGVHRRDKTGEAKTPGQGMSGAIVGKRNGSTYNECGFAWGGTSFSVGKKVYTAIFFHGPDVVLPITRNALPHMRQRVEDRRK
jgi:hypothetical protein